LVSGIDLTSPQMVSALVEGMMQRSPLARIEGRGYQLVNPTLQKDRLVLHVLNYDTGSPQKNVKVSLSPTGYPKEVGALLNRTSVARWLTPDYEANAQLPISWAGDKATIVIPELRVSGLLVVTPK
jgi:hypothetical protein